MLDGVLLVGTSLLLSSLLLILSRRSLYLFVQFTWLASYSYRYFTNMDAEPQPGVMLPGTPPTSWFSVYFLHLS